MKITTKLTIGEFAALVATQLRKYGIDTVLSGGAVVSIYTNNKYQSFDIDFISPADVKKIDSAMTELGFKKKGKDFSHPDTHFFVEFPSGPLAVGNRIIRSENEITIKGQKLKLLSPTQSVMDRLCAYFFWNDRQSLDQAIWIAQAQPIKLSFIDKWAREEGELTKFRDFSKALKTTQNKK